MSAYAMPQREHLAPLLHPDPSPTTAQFPRLRVAAMDSASASSTATDRTLIEESRIIYVLLDRLADRLAIAILERLGGADAEPRDEWLDSREAANYLGLHRDTLRRLKAARAIPAEQDGRGCKLFFRRTALDEWRLSGGRSRRLTAA